MQNEPFLDETSSGMRQFWPGTVQRTAREQNLLIGTARSDCQRLSPVLTVSHGNAEEMLRHLGQALQRVKQHRVEVV